MTVRRLALVGFALVSCVLAAHPEALSEPLPLCRPGTLAVAPAYAELGAPPEITQWRDVWIGPDNCFQQVDGPMELVVTLAARFRHSGGLEDLAARAGAISATRSIRYWSVTNDRWRPLISDAFAVSDAETRVPRFNFASDEVLSGESLHFLQDDNRSKGLNLFGLSGQRLGRGRFAVEFINLTDIRAFLAKIYGARALASIHVFEHLEGNIWGYYGIFAARDGVAMGTTASFKNRAAAYQRFITGIPTDSEPPLAR